MGFASKEQLQDLMEFMGNNIHVPQLVQHFDGNNIYSTDESIVGCWIDGRPIYKKTIIKTVPEGGATGSSITFNLSDEVSNLGTVVTEKVMARASNSNNAHISPVYNGTFAEIKFEHARYAANNEVKYTFTNRWSVAVEAYLIVQYTKTTDAANSYIIAKENTYNLTEKVVGKWVDGKPVYQKTIDFGTLPNATNKGVAHGITNLDRIIDIFGNYSGEGYYGTIPNPMEHKDGTDYTMRVYCNSTEVRVATNADCTPYSAYITLQYTKTN